MPNCPTCSREFDTRRGMTIHHKAIHGESIAGFSHSCATCGDTFRDKSSKAKYCSRECYAEAHSERMSGEKHPMWAGGKDEYTCKQCGDTFSRYASNGNPRYCSMECAGKAQDIGGENNPFYQGGKRVTKTCKWCDGPFEVWECESHQQFCSVQCKGDWMSEYLSGENHPNYKGGIDYGPGWNEAKKAAVRERDGYQCQNCGRSQDDHIALFGQKLTVHHIEKARSFDDAEKRNAMENLVTLCRSGECHDKWEAMSPLRPDV